MATKPAARPPRSELRETVLFFLKLAIFVFVIRSFLFSPFSIPSGSMLPRMMVGDYLFITKWNYGYSRYSLPWNLPLIPGRIFPRTPDRGDVVVFKAPPEGRDNWVKRVIGLPGDRVQMQHGQLFLNGKPVPKQRIADFVLPVTPNFGCPFQFQDEDAAGKPVCRYPQYEETLPNGKRFRVLDQGTTPADDTGVYTVPEGHVFLMGDNRDDSADSRFPVAAGQGIGFVPMENLEGKAVVTFWSTDGSAQWLLPWTWISAARFSRIGEGF
ncbi:signal peptidase I [Sphingomonas sp. 3-13AW]|jgi:signal peptidase I|uniref:signal peptidase I n=1 Tax=Sphingomonas sp. 3-13AW TaxID=3050450 RepID=UPI003BB56055